MRQPLFPPCVSDVPSDVGFHPPPDPAGPSSASRRQWLHVGVLLGVAGCWSDAVWAQAAAPAAAATGDADEEAMARQWLEKADEIRFPRQSFQVEIDVVSKVRGQVTDTRRYRVLSKGNENTIVQLTEPASERGQALLMRGRDLWMFLPTVSQPVRLSLSQRLTGQVANGDLARANFTGDYTPRLLRAERIEGVEHQVLELTAVDRSVTYARVLYTIEKASSSPVRAEFFSLSNRLLKTCRYEQFKPMAGARRPTRLVMIDALREGEETVLDYSDMKLRDLPDKLFTKDALKRLEI